MLIAMYNVWDLIGRYIPLVESLKLTSRRGLMVAILSRFFLVPAFYFTARYADQGWMIFLTSFLGLTNGYLTVCVFTTAPKGYKVSLSLLSLFVSLSLSLSLSISLPLLTSLYLSGSRSLSPPFRLCISLSPSSPLSLSLSLSLSLCPCLP